MTWRWRTGTVPTGWPSAGTSVAAVAARGRVHVFLARPDGRAVSHLAFGPDPAGARLPDLPLASVSGAAAGRDGPLVAGARTGDHAAVVCAVDAEGGAVRLTELPPAAEPIGAWPVPVDADPRDADPPWVVWATGRGPATIRFGVLTGARVTVRHTVSTAHTLWTLQAVRAAGGVDAIYQTAAGTEFVRVGGTASAHAPVADPPPIGERAVLASGAVLTPTDGHRVAVWDTLTRVPHELALPEPPERGAARVAAPRILGPRALLTWTTELPGSGPTSGRRQSTAAARGWIASLDTNAWRVGAATELPAAPAAVATLDDLVMVVRTAGGPRVWIGTTHP